LLLVRLVFTLLLLLLLLVLCYSFPVALQDATQVCSQHAWSGRAGSSANPLAFCSSST
jgi:hypothetical protein